MNCKHGQSESYPAHPFHPFLCVWECAGACIYSSLSQWTSFISFSLRINFTLLLWLLNCEVEHDMSLWNAQSLSGLKSVLDAVLLCLIWEAVGFSFCEALWNYIPLSIYKTVIKKLSGWNPWGVFCIRPLGGSVVFFVARTLSSKAHGIAFTQSVSINPTWKEKLIHQDN